MVPGYLAAFCVGATDPFFSILQAVNLLSGGESIAHGLQELPKTKHILDRDLRAEAKTLFENVRRNFM